MGIRAFFGRQGWTIFGRAISTIVWDTQEIWHSGSTVSLTSNWILSLFKFPLSGLAKKLLDKFSQSEVLLYPIFFPFLGEIIPKNGSYIFLLTTHT